MTILLNEGRKEDLIKKYESKFTDEGLSNVVNDQFIKQTNYKYADFILKNLDSAYSFSELEEVIEALKKFDKFQTNLKKKDIKLYTGFFDLITTISDYTKGKEKPKSKKIYEDNKFIVIEPQNYVASCKYGSKTRWCTTMKDNDDYFNRHTSGRQGLYYVISKKDLEENLYKIAIHFDNNGDVIFYDASDSTFGKREIALFKSAYPEMWDAINEYQEEVHPDLTRERIVRELSGSVEYGDERVIKMGEAHIQLKLLGFEIVEQSGDNFMVNNEIQIFDIKSNPKVLLDKYMVFINLSLIKRNTLRALDVECQLQSLDEDVALDLNLDGYSFQARFTLSEHSNIPNEIADIIMYDVYKTLRNDSVLLSYFHKSSVWTPNKRYGYTFAENKGLIKKLAEWLDESKIGTKLDFLVDIGILDKKTNNGKTFYSRKDKNEFSPSVNWRGHFASFFASAKAAGILNYRKIGNKFLLIKGPNFDEFKRGELKAL